jgi:hypothetical protein
MSPLWGGHPYAQAGNWSTLYLLVPGVPAGDRGQYDSWLCKLGSEWRYRLRIAERSK